MQNILWDQLPLLQESHIDDETRQQLEAKGQFYKKIGIDEEQLFACYNFFQFDTHVDDGAKCPFYESNHCWVFNLDEEQKNASGQTIISRIQFEFFLIITICN